MSVKQRKYSANSKAHFQWDADLIYSPGTGTKGKTGLLHLEKKVRCLWREYSKNGVRRTRALPKGKRKREKCVQNIQPLYLFDRKPTSCSEFFVPSNCAMSFLLRECQSKNNHNGTVFLLQRCALFQVLFQTLDTTLQTLTKQVVISKHSEK